ncbi:MAG: sugar phosphate nucleotidyltransferase [Patescibacteria group bacterium]|nr:sugar phosphate nucleotidyltransferase [Patescibacteria group bacterium]
MENINVVLLAGGDSSRLWPLGDKNLITFVGKPLIYHTVAKLSRWGFKKFIIITNKDNRHTIEKWMSVFSSIDVTFVDQINRKGMAGAVLSVKDIVAGKPILVVGPSDVYEDILFLKFQKMAKKEYQADGIISGITMETYFPGGYLEILKDEVKGLREKPSPKKLPSNIVTFVFDYFKDSTLLIQKIEKIKEDNDDVYEQAIDGMVKDGLRLKFLHYNGFWGYLKYPWHVLNLSAYFLNQLENKTSNNVQISESAVITGKVYLDSNVRILENAKIIGPSYIGKGTVIGNNVLVRESEIGESCVVGNGTEIARSHIGNNCWFHTNYVGDSVISDNVSMGSGTVLANFRLDEGIINSKIRNEKIQTDKVKLGAVIGDNVRIGVNSSIMPGVKVGKYSLIGAGVVLNKDLEDKKYCLLSKQEYVIRDNLQKTFSSTRKRERNSLKFL